MGQFHEELKSARLALGHKTARAFFTWLKASGVSCNYSYYMQLEQGGLPSEKVANEMAAALKGERGERLILAYCRGLFPRHGYLFPEIGEAAAKATAAKVPYAPSGQKELTPRQVAVIATDKTTYHVFLLATLARKPVPLNEMQKLIKGKTLQTALDLLARAGLVQVADEAFAALAVEAKFPAADSKELKEAYAKFDLWDESFGEEFSLESILNKMMIRRVSGRYLVIIRNQLESLFELVRSSDETDLRFNDKVLQLKVVFRQGNLPG